MKLLGVCLVVLFSSACAARYQAAPAVKNLSAFQQSSATALIDGACMQVVSFKNGRTVRLKLDAAICRDADLAIAIEQAVKAAQPPPTLQAPVK